jgi:hypothetical protein
MNSRQIIEYIDQNPHCVVDDPQDSRYCACEDCTKAREWIKAHQDLWEIYRTFGKYKALRAL